LARLTIPASNKIDANLAELQDDFLRRVEAMPPGMCPIALVQAIMSTSTLQTCGKCVPCRDGMPRLTHMMQQVLDCRADEALLAQMEELAQMIRDSSDCAIGYDAAELFLRSRELFAEEYESHLVKHECAGDTTQTVACEAMCPAHVNVPAYVALVGEGKYAEAIKVIRADNPFPTACAYVCEHPCEDSCRRRLIDAPLNIRGIKKYAVDQVSADKVDLAQVSVSTGKRIAVVGGGPSGLSCAYFLALMGHEVVVFEQRTHLGGMLRYGIPAYRLPRERLDEDIRAITSLDNIEVKLGSPIGKTQLEALSAEFDALYIAVGAQLGKSLELDNELATGVFSAVELLGTAGEGHVPDFSGKKVAVIGGGNVAMDCARTAIRAEAEEVSVVYRRRQDDMTALPIEVESAIAESVEMITLEAPVGIEVNEAGACTGVITQPQKVQQVKDGRPSVAPADKPQTTVDAEVVLVAIGQAVDVDEFEQFGMKTNRGRFVADGFLHAAGYQNIFVGGDCQTGPATAIKAIGAGRVAARNIDEFLGYHHALGSEVAVPEAHPNDRTPKGRVEIIERPARERKHDFSHVEQAISREEIVWECGRCLRCDHFGSGVLDEGRERYA
jgi:NADPH-dependent glutamate synthase beta subunit-like oxidoreductase